MRTFRDLWIKLKRSVGFRKAFVGAEVKRLIPFQISAIRNVRGWSQEELARRAGLTQGVISRAEDPDYGNLTFNTVIKIANGFDVAFVGKFVPYSELTDWYVKLSEESAGNVPSFGQEDNAMGEAPATLESVDVAARVFEVAEVARQIMDEAMVSKTQRSPLATDLVVDIALKASVYGDLVQQA